jgi:von Willebrand factor type A domain
MPAPAIDSHDAHHAGMSPRQLWWRKTALPLLTSLSLHVGIVVIGLLCFTAYKVINRPVLTEDQPIVPSGGINTQVADIPKGDIDDKLHLPTQANVRDVVDAGWSKTPSPHVNPMQGEEGSNSDPIIAVGSGGSFHPGKPGAAIGTGEDPDGGRLKSFGYKDGGGKGTFDTPTVDPKQGPPPSIAFVCDASGSMMEKMPALKLELSKKVTSLRPWQEFSITFFQDERPMSLSPSLLIATPGNKHAAQMFLDDVTTIGTTDPIPGIKQAFAERPKIMFLLTDGDFPNNDAVLAEIRSLEKQQHVVIHTIAFVGGGDNDVKFIDLLKQVAQETGGTFKKVNADALDGN